MTSFCRKPSGLILLPAPEKGILLRALGWVWPGAGLQGFRAGSFVWMRGIKAGEGNLSQQVSEVLSNENTRPVIGQRALYPAAAP